MCLKKAKKFREYEKQYKKQVGRRQTKNKETILERILKEYKKK